MATDGRNPSPAGLEPATKPGDVMDSRYARVVMIMSALRITQNQQAPKALTEADRQCLHDLYTAEEALKRALLSAEVAARLECLPVDK